MKTKFLLITLLLIASTTIVFAKPASVKSLTPPGTLKQEEVRKEIQERKEERIELFEQKREELQQRIQEHKATSAAKLQVRNQVRAKEYFGRIETRFEATIQRLETLIERIEARLAIYKESDPDLDLTDIQMQIDEAKTLLTQTSADIQATSDSLDDVLDNDNPKDAFSVIRESISEAKTNLIKVHSILVHVIGDIKGLRVGNTTVNTATEEADTN
jgi:DNA repair exonuclease SbcCD ATPase subunit